MTEIHVDAAKLVEAAGKMDGFQTQAANVKASALAAGPDDGYGWWGLIGNACQLHSQYTDAAREVHENLELPEKFLQRCGESLLESAENYRKANKKILEDLKKVEQALQDGPEGAAQKFERPGSLRDGGVVRIDFLEDIPTISSGLKGVKSATEGQVADLVSFAGDAWGAAALFQDPVAFLVRAGLGFLIDFVQPLEDALAYITGHPERIDAAANKWGAVAQSLQDLSREIKSVPEQDLSEAVWKGPAGSGARARIESFTEGLDALAQEIIHLKAILGASKSAMELAQSLVVEIIVLFVQWLIAVWGPAMAAAPVTGGASVASAGAATTGFFARASAQVARIVQRLRALLIRIGIILRKLAAEAAARGPRAMAEWAVGGLGAKKPDRNLWVPGAVQTTPFKLAGPAWDALNGGGGGQSSIADKLNPNTAPTTEAPPKTESRES